MATKFAQHANRRQTPQSEPIPGEAMVANNAGGYVYEVDKWMRLQRFLILGTDGGTYYVRERELTRDNAAVVDACLAEDGMRTVNAIVAVSDAGRAPKNDPAIFALALAAAVQNPDAKGIASADIRAYALDNLSKVCRIPTHLFHFIEYTKALRRVSRMLRTAIRLWYARWTPETFAFELVKYQQRDGWSHRDVFRQAHVNLGAPYQAAMRWAVRENNEDGVPVLGGRIVTRRNQGWPKGATEGAHYAAVGELPAIIAAFEEAKTLSPQAGVRLIRDHGLTREMVPTEWLNHAYVWEALLEKMPPTAMIRNLGKMTAVGLLEPMAAATKTVVARLSDADYIRRKPVVHPLTILNALRTYGSGRGDKGSLTWKPVTKIVDALDDAFYASFGNVEPTGKAMMLALDVSHSMSAPIAGSTLSCCEASSALALITARVEPGSVAYRFNTGLEPIDISPRMRLDDVLRRTRNINGGGTDCSLPMVYAGQHRLDVDAFVVYTDNETWAGRAHPSQALRDYRAKQNNQAAAQVVVGMTATEFTIADPKDSRALDVVGFDLQTPQAIAEFVRG